MSIIILDPEVSNAKIDALCEAVDLEFLQIRLEYFKKLFESNFIVCGDNGTIGFDQFVKMMDTLI